MFRVFCVQGGAEGGVKVSYLHAEGGGWGQGGEL